MKHNHVGNVSFSVISENEDGATSEQLIYAVLRRLAILPKDEIQEAISIDDSYESDEEDEINHNKILDDANEKRQPLIDNVIEQILEDIQEHYNLSGLTELIKLLPDTVLQNYLSE